MIGQIPSEGHRALDSYANTLAFLTQSGRSWPWDCSAPTDLLFIKELEGVENLYRSMSAVAAAVPDAQDEEWNPLSQRPHSPLPPAISDELGAEVSSLKEAIDAFTTLTHEMMHVALCEPYFTGASGPRQQRAFREFFLMSEGFCFFFADIVVSGLVRARLPDGEFALERETPSNAHFHPIRAFQAMGIHDREQILDMYLESFAGRSTPLLRPQNTTGFAASLALKIYNFYAGSQPYLKDLYRALSSFGGLSEFAKRFCAIPGLPSILSESTACLAKEDDPKPYFKEFFRHGLSHLQQMAPEQIQRVRCRRMLQMRAYYALQIRWLLSEKQVALLGQKWTTAHSRRLLRDVETYLDGLEALLVRLAQEAESLPLDALRELDAFYESQVRASFLAHGAWTAHRWLIAPRRAGGGMSVALESRLKVRDPRRHLLETLEFLLEELTLGLGKDRKLLARAEALARIQEVAALGASLARGTGARLQTATRKLRTILVQPHIMELWALPLASFDPVHNLYRELLFSYK